MAMYRSCPCGKAITTRRDLCAGCLDDYGTNKDLWPDWLKFAVKDHQREWNYERNHDEFEQWDKVNYLEMEENPRPLKDAEWSDEIMDLETALGKLDENQRTALVLRSQGFTHQEVADEMGVSLRSAKGYALTAQSIMKKLLE